MDNEVSVRVTGDKAGTKPAKPRHGGVGYCMGEQVTFYDGLGWVTEKELAVASICGRQLENVYEGRTSFVHASDADGSHGWRYCRGSVDGPFRREKVFRKHGEWQICLRWLRLRAQSNGHLLEVA